MDAATSPKVKICGITRSEDAADACRLGADFIGVIVETPESLRSVDPALAQVILAASACRTVVLTCDHSWQDTARLFRQLRPFALQLAGDEDPEVVHRLTAIAGARVWKSLHVSPDEDLASLPALLTKAQEFVCAGADAIVLDTAVSRQGQRVHGGTGRPHNWILAQRAVAELDVPLVLAGGITPDNAAQAVAATGAWAIDASSGVEMEPGTKDPAKMQALIEAVRGA